MPNIMFRQHDDGCTCYIAKRDGFSAQLEFEQDDNWAVGLISTQAAYFERKVNLSLPITLRLKRAGGINLVRLRSIVMKTC